MGRLARRLTGFFLIRGALQGAPEIALLCHNYYDIYSTSDFASNRLTEVLTAMLFLRRSNGWSAFAKKIGKQVQYGFLYMGVLIQGLFHI